MSDESVIVGLGNPGAKYDGTRHNVGFAVVDLLRECSGAQTLEEFYQKARSHVASAIDGRLDLYGWDDKKSVQTARFQLLSVSGYLVKPRTYMNRSGEPLREILAFRKIPLSRVVVVHDEIDIPVGTLRVKCGGGEGGHNGLRSIAAECGGRDFGRIRCGVGKPSPDSSAFQGEEGIARWVLSRYSTDERSIVEGLVVKAAEAAISLISHGLKDTQNRFNR